MISWQLQQKLRPIKEKLAVVAKNRNFLLALAIIGVFVIGFYINTYTARIVELKEQTENQLSTCEGKLTDCSRNSTSLQQNLNSCQSNLDSCSTDRQKLSDLYKNASFDFLTCQTNFGVLNNTFNELSTNYQMLANSSATNICCKKKIDDPSLKYFYIQNGVIYCTSDSSQTSAIPFVCPSLAS